LINPIIRASTCLIKALVISWIVRTNYLTKKLIRRRKITKSKMIRIDRRKRRQRILSSSKSSLKILKREVKEAGGGIF